MAVSYTRLIPPGGEGKIVIKVHTGNYGGSKLIKNAEVLTSDPARAKMRLTISGSVEKFATISPQQVRLIGPGNKRINQPVLIFPRKEYPFKIIEAKARIGRDIRYSQDVYKDGDAEGYILIVENARETQGRYYDTIYLRTDSNVRPEIAIPVYGNITSDSKTGQNDLP